MWKVFWIWANIYEVVVFHGFSITLRWSAKFGSYFIESKEYIVHEQIYPIPVMHACNQ